MYICETAAGAPALTAHFLTTHTHTHDRTHIKASRFGRQNPHLTMSRDGVYEVALRVFVCHVWPRASRIASSAITRQVQ